jgi:hypothetical protein
VLPMTPFLCADAQGGLAKPVKALVVDDYDRAAPLGVGNVKVGLLTDSPFIFRISLEQSSSSCIFPSGRQLRFDVQTWCC